MTTKVKQSGFTLVEVMVAFLVVATAISALLFQMMGNIDNAAYLRDKTIAQWVALNQLELAYIENANTNKLIESERNGQEDMAGRTWYWQMKPVKTQADGFIQLEVSVSDVEGEDGLVTMVGLVDAFHKP